MSRLHSYVFSQPSRLQSSACVADPSLTVSAEDTVLRQCVGRLVSGSLVSTGSSVVYFDAVAIPLPPGCDHVYQSSLLREDWSFYRQATIVRSSDHCESCMYTCCCGTAGWVVQLDGLAGRHHASVTCECLHQAIAMNGAVFDQGEKVSHASRDVYVSLRRMLAARRNNAHVRRGGVLVRISSMPLALWRMRRQDGSSWIGRRYMCCRRLGLCRLDCRRRRLCVCRRRVPLLPLPFARMAHASGRTRLTGAFVSPPHTHSRREGGRIFVPGVIVHAYSQPAPLWTHRHVRRDGARILIPGVMVHA